jgi:hypothetical protein
MSLLGRLRAWWNKDTLERAEEEARMTPIERDRAEEDYEGRKDDTAAASYLGGDAAEFESDAEPPRR